MKLVGHLTAIVSVALLGAACAPTLQLQVLEPSLVTSPPEIHTLAVVDRSRAKNIGQGILGTLEAMVTGEALGADNEGRSRAMMGAVTGLRNSPRFDAVEPFVPKKELESSLWDKEMSWKTAQRVCRDAGCQGIVSLEAFDSDTTVDVEMEEQKSTDDNGNEVVKRVYEAQRQTRVVTAWRYYDVVNKQIIDDVRTWDNVYSWTERGSTRDEAIRRLMPQTDSVAYVGELAGASYARRIAPTYVWVTRSYYGRGDDTLKQAKNHVKARDWAGAIDLWDGLFRNNPDPKIRGKAAFNLALAAEVDGDLRQAASWATEAAVLLANGKSRNYRALLDRRLAEQQRLASQMATSAPGAIPDDEERPLAVPGERVKTPAPRRVEEEQNGGSPSGGNRSSTGGK